MSIKKELFFEPYEFYGESAEKAKKLTDTIIDANSGSKIFNSLIELLMFAAIYGCFYNLREEPFVKNTKNNFTIFQETIARYRENLLYIYKLVILYSYQNDPDKAIHNAFRNYRSEENKKLFDEYVHGGISELYRQFMEGTTANYNSYLNVVKRLINDFKIIEETQVDFDFSVLEDL